MNYYPKYLPPQDKPITLVELGVYQGASMKLWGTRFTNRDTRIIGIDIDLSQVPKVKNPWPGKMWDLPENVELWQADQADPDMIAQAHEVDVLIDDASHFSSKTIASFHVWWPVIKPGGMYVVEDTHCSYDVHHYGPRESGPPLALPSARIPRHPRLEKVTTMEFLKRLSDDVNWNYHGYDRFNPLYQDVGYVHFYPGITFIGKASK